jgi:hypothetical protein
VQKKVPTLHPSAPGVQSQLCHFLAVSPGLTTHVSLSVKMMTAMVPFRVGTKVGRGGAQGTALRESGP